MSKFELRLVSDDSPERSDDAPLGTCGKGEQKTTPGSHVSTHATRCTAKAQPLRQQRELARLTGTADPKTVSVSVRSIVPLLMEAAEQDRTWLQDFADDPVRIDADLYDVLLAYQQLNQARVA